MGVRKVVKKKFGSKCWSFDVKRDRFLSYLRFQFFFNKKRRKKDKLNYIRVYIYFNIKYVCASVCL